MNDKLLDLRIARARGEDLKTGAQWAKMYPVCGVLDRNEYYYNVVVDSDGIGGHSISADSPNYGWNTVCQMIEKLGLTVYMNRHSVTVHDDDGNIYVARRHGYLLGLKLALVLYMEAHCDINREKG